MSNTSLISGKLKKRTEAKQLISNFSRQIQLFETYLELGLSLRKSLINNNIEEHQQVNTQQDNITIKIHDLEQQRLDITKRFISDDTYQHKTEKELEVLTLNTKCEDLYPYMEEEDKFELQELREALREKIDLVQNINRVNAVLIENARQLSSSTLKIITNLSTDKDNKQSQVYGQKGKMAVMEKKKLNIFNQKA